jgi:predicted CXXCH cytochrome family protein
VLKLVKTKALKFIMLASLAMVLVLSFSAVAFAAVSGHTFDPASGHPESTNKCLQCHDIHDAAADYVLLVQSTVTDTCGTCHNLYLTAPSGARADHSDPTGVNGFPGIIGTVAERTAYKETRVDAANLSGHRLPNDLVGVTHDLAAMGVSELTALNIWANGTPSGDGSPFQWAAYSPLAPNVTGADAFEATGGLYCASCHTPHGAFGQQLDVAIRIDAGVDSQHDNKLLSSRPNHTTRDLSTLITDWPSEGYLYCMACHDGRAPDHTIGSVEDNLYNHPVEFCLICHADNRADAERDFPHTSPNYRLVPEVPDALCIGCHLAGQLP